MTRSYSLRVAYQGEQGAYSEMATSQFFSSGSHPIQPHPCPSFADMFSLLNKGEVDRAVVPIENLLAGTIHPNLDLLLRYTDLHIVGEVDFRVRHCPVVNKRVELRDIQVVRSHYMALNQCKKYLAENGLTPEVAYDTAGSAKLMQKSSARDAAAVCSSRAAEIYDLKILAANIEDDNANYTRFLVLSKKPASYVPSVPGKTSLVLTIDKNGPVGLHSVLSIFASSGIDLTKIESRHIHVVCDASEEGYHDLLNNGKEQRRDYVFYIDIARHSEEPKVATTLKHLQNIAPFYRVLGSYAQHIRHIHERH